MSIVDRMLGMGAVTLSLVLGGCGATDEGARREEAVASAAAALTSYAANVTAARVIAHGSVVLLSCGGGGLNRVVVRANLEGNVDGSVESGVAVVRLPQAEFEALLNASSVSFVTLDVDDGGRVVFFDFVIG